MLEAGKERRGVVDQAVVLQNNPSSHGWLSNDRAGLKNLQWQLRPVQVLFEDCSTSLRPRTAAEQPTIRLGGETQAEVVEERKPCRPHSVFPLRTPVG